MQLDLDGQWGVGSVEGGGGSASYISFHTSHKDLYNICEVEVMTETHPVESGKKKPNHSSHHRAFSHHHMDRTGLDQDATIHGANGETRARKVLSSSFQTKAQTQNKTPRNDELRGVYF